jgi:hypothetical protein
MPGERALPVVFRGLCIEHMSVVLRRRGLHSRRPASQNTHLCCTVPRLLDGRKPLVDGTER